MENRKALLPLCSGVLGVVSLILQVIAVATPYWAYFRSDDPFGNGNLPSGNYVEEGHYGLWTTCVTINRGVKLYGKRCDIGETRFNPGMLRYYAAALAVANVALLLIFLFPIPAQLAYVCSGKGIVSVRYRTLTLIKILTLVLGACCGIGAVVLIGVHTQPYYLIPKGWSFGLQIVVVILQVFLFICVALEHVLGRKYPSIPLSKIKRHNSASQRGGHRNPAFSMTSPDNTSGGKGLEKNHHQLSTVSVTSESGKPISNGHGSDKFNDKYSNGNRLTVTDDDVDEPRSRKSMQYLEEVDLQDNRHQKQQKQQQQQQPQRESTKPRKPYYKNSGYRKSRESDLDTSSPSVSSRNGSRNHASLSSDTVNSFSKSTDV